jgi:TonB family protein
VYDAAGARVPGANVVAVRTDTDQKLTTVTDQEGNFSIGPLPEGGIWQITVEAPGFARNVQRVDRNHFDITLDVAAIQESVVVHGKGTAAATAGGPHRVRVGGNVVPAKLVYRVDPEYPDDVRSRGVQGDVVLRAVVSLKGTVLSLTSVSSPDPQLTEAAIKAVNEWRYQPSLLNGEPVETATTITVNFQLEP